VVPSGHVIGAGVAEALVVRDGPCDCVVGFTGTLGWGAWAGAGGGALGGRGGGAFGGAGPMTFVSSNPRAPGEMLLTFHFPSSRTALTSKPNLSSILRPSGKLMS
jgi:hypothetical protein